MKRNLKVMVSAFVALMTMPVFAQTTVNVEPAKLSAEETTKVSNILNSKPAEKNGISKKDSTYFSMLLANGNQPIVRKVTEAGILGGKVKASVGDSVRVFITRKEGGFEVYYDVFHRVDSENTTATAKTRVAGAPALNGQAIARTRRSVTEQEGSKTATYTKTSLNQVSDEYIEAVKAGEAKLFDNVSTDVEGKKINKLFVGANAGGNFAFNGSELHPEFGLELGWETKYMILAARGVMSWSNFNETAGENEVSEDHKVLKNASVTGRYINYRVTAEAALKLLQSVGYTNWVALYVEGGLGLSRTDGDAAEASSTLVGLTVGAGLEGQYTIAKKVALVGRLGGVLLPKNYHDSRQDFNLGLNASVGIRFLL